VSAAARIAALVLASLLASICIGAEPLTGMKRIGILFQDRLVLSRIEAFPEKFRDLGYVEGKNVVYDYRLAAPGDLLPAAQDLMRSGVDLVVAVGTPVTLAAKRASVTVPIVFYASDPVGSGLIASLARPGGNATGVASLSEETGAKRLELLKELLPRATRVAVLGNPDNPASLGQQPAVNSAAESLGIKILVLNVRRSEDLDAVFPVMNRKHADALLILGDPILIAQGSRIAEHAFKQKLPSIFLYRMFTDAGGLMSYGPDFAAVWRQCAVYADKILKGAKPADLPVERPTKFELIVNLRTAKAFGLTVPQSILIRADEVIR